MRRFVEKTTFLRERDSANAFPSKQKWKQTLSFPSPQTNWSGLPSTFLQTKTLFISLSLSLRPPHFPPLKIKSRVNTVSLFPSHFIASAAAVDGRSERVRVAKLMWFFCVFYLQKNFFHPQWWRFLLCRIERSLASMAGWRSGELCRVGGKIII